jgi:hypothetical protein
MIIINVVETVRHVMFNLVSHIVRLPIRVKIHHVEADIARNVAKINTINMTGNIVKNAPRNVIVHQNLPQKKITKSRKDVINAIVAIVIA